MSEAPTRFQLPAAAADAPPQTAWAQPFPPLRPKPVSPSHCLDASAARSGHRCLRRRILCQLLTADKFLQAWDARTGLARTGLARSTLDRFFPGHGAALRVSGPVLDLVRPVERPDPLRAYRCAPRGNVRWRRCLLSALRARDAAATAQHRALLDLVDALPREGAKCYAHLAAGTSAPALARHQRYARAGLPLCRCA